MKIICQISVMSLCLGLVMSCMTGCGKAPEEAGGQVDVTGNRTFDRQTSVPVNGTSVDNSEQAKLMRETVRLVREREQGSPESIPADMPVYTGAKIGDTMKTVEADSLMVLLQTPDPIDRVTAFYKETCAAAGWTESSSMVDPAGTLMQLLSYTKDDRKLSVAIVNNQIDNVVDITMTSAKLDSTRPESAGHVTAYFPAQRRQPSSTGNKTDTP